LKGSQLSCHDNYPHVFRDKEPVKLGKWAGFTAVQELPLS
jgi:hypothetical protein